MTFKLKIFIELIIHYFVSLLIYPSKNIELKSILLIRLDAIGDYILFSNFIEILKKSEQYKDYEITLLGNIAWKDLAKTLDSQYINNFIWLNRRNFYKNPVYRFKKLKEITSRGYEIVLSPVYSREFFYADTIVNLLHAKEKIGSIGDLSNIKEWHKKISDRYYTKLIPASDQIIFEFYRNKEFFENLLGKQLEIDKPFIDIRNLSFNIELPKNYSIIFLGASDNYRKWSVKNFVEIAKYIHHTYDMNIVLAGGSTDIEDAEKFKALYKGQLYNFVGKTSLLELLKIISNGNLMISNETSAPHFAVALDIRNIIVISNGNHFGRFTPYPKKITDKYHVIYHPEIENKLDNYKKLSNNYGYGSRLDIDEINVEKVLKKIDSILEVKNYQ